MSGIGGGIWSQKRSSFKMEKTAQRNAAREALLAAPNQGRGGLKGEQTPSPAVSDGSGALPFTIPLEPPPKAGRSLSHSQGQREFPMSSGANDHTLPLGLLTEEVDTETDSELGGGITQTTSHPPFGSALHRTATYPPTYETFYDDDDAAATAGESQKGDRRLEGAFGNLSLGPSALIKSTFVATTVDFVENRALAASLAMAKPSGLGRCAERQRISPTLACRPANTTWLPCRSGPPQSLDRRGHVARRSDVRMAEWRSAPR